MQLYPSTLKNIVLLQYLTNNHKLVCYSEITNNANVEVGVQLNEIIYF